ncbi:hypothetical protein QNH09_gp18 [Aeromonas phage PVN03]|uniref:Uncharacterized protein n=1 Tax=Aeromonas phage PVN03 TaxID=2822864 RepID=A0AAE7RCI1_9CAUD|nr:hypothetical protein QNH09_gp18 [Aeromonas phage PVN03]QTQ06800.1 hypothetical protein [Aeromonas phage PVN03]
MYTNEMLEQVLIAMLDSGTITENTCHALLAADTKMIPRLGEFVANKTISNKQANAIMKSMRELAKAEAANAGMPS